jgi:hypothetical protein
MSALPPEHSAQLLLRHGLTSTSMQLCPLGQIVPGTQSFTSKHPAVKVMVVPQPGSSQRQPFPFWQVLCVVNEVHGSGGGHGGISTIHVPFSEQCALGPHAPMA